MIDDVKIDVTSVEVDENDPTLLKIKMHVMPPTFSMATIDLTNVIATSFGYSRTMNKLKDHERAVMSAVMFDDGMVPIDNPTHDIGRPLATLSKDDARTMKRKFRKVWRKLARDEARKLGRKDKPIEAWMTNRFGAGKSNPSRQDRAARKQIVQSHYYEKLVRPILDEFEFGGKNGPEGSKLTGEEPT